MKENELKILREKIDSIDDELLKLIIKRTSIVEEIGILKKSKEEVVDKNRESKVLSRILKLHSGNFSKDSLVRIWREIFHTSANIQLKKNDILKPKRGVESIQLYTGGISKAAGFQKLIKLSSNESPFGPSKKTIEAYNKVTDNLSRYPELTADSLQEAIGKKNNLNSNQIISGTGSDEILIMTALTFCSPGDEIIHAQHGFEMYPIITKYTGAESVLASENDYKININSVISNITNSTKIIFIANPNNPTGTYLSNHELRTLMDKVPNNIVVVIDTAYAEFADADDYDKSFDLADEYSNVIITRTFSKAYSLAGLRLGWGYGNQNLINMIKKLRPPFNIPPGAISAGIAALNDDDHLNSVVNNNLSLKKWFIEELKKLDLNAYNTQANFVFVIVPETKNQSALKISDYLLLNGIAVRYLSSYKLPNAIRITIGREEELNECLKFLKIFKEENE